MKHFWLLAPKLYGQNASKITTIDYTKKRYEHNRLEWPYVYELLSNVINTKQTELFGNVASYSSIEHLEANTLHAQTKWTLFSRPANK